MIWNGAVVIWVVKGAESSPVDKRCPTSNPIAFPPSPLPIPTHAPHPLYPSYCSTPRSYFNYVSNQLFSFPDSRVFRKSSQHEKGDNNIRPEQRLQKAGLAGSILADAAGREGQAAVVYLWALWLQCLFHF